MANPRNYYVKLRNDCGTTIGTHVYAHSDYAAMQLQPNATLVSEPCLLV